jgi:hypothetical protein
MYFNQSQCSFEGIKPDLKLPLVISNYTQPQSYNPFFAQTSSSLGKRTNYLAKVFGETILKINTSVPAARH